MWMYLVQAYTGEEQHLGKEMIDRLSMLEKDWRLVAYNRIYFII